jgi:hypothetical protein
MDAVELLDQLITKALCLSAGGHHDRHPFVASEPDVTDGHDRVAGAPVHIRLVEPFGTSLGLVEDGKLESSGRRYGSPDRERSRSQQPMIKRSQSVASHCSKGMYRLSPRPRNPPRLSSPGPMNSNRNSRRECRSRCWTLAPIGDDAVGGVADIARLELSEQARTECTHIVQLDALRALQGRTRPGEWVSADIDVAFGGQLRW